jgi:serine/threonine protein kinase/tetratricopeptide (TPR) repeat protein
MPSETHVEVIGRRYRLLETLGRGGMGTVYRADDLLTGETIALKQVSQAQAIPAHLSDEDSAGLRLALAQEFKVLSSLRHPNIIGVLDYGFDHQRQPYFTMQLMANAQTILEAGKNQPTDFQIGLLVQLLQALVYLHRRGVLHRDLKPGNVLVSGGQLKVLDFGLSLIEHESRDMSGMTSGTLNYMAPEVLMGENVSETSDLYAVGVMAYEMFAGRHPFDTNNVTRLVNDIIQTEPDVFSIDLEYDLALVLQRLLAKSPEDRYRNAAHVIADLAKALQQPIAIETAATRESFLQAAKLVGRDTELAQLTEALQNAVDSHGSGWLISGESGVGKSRLMDEIRTLAMVKGALVLRGQAVSEGSSPYHLWRPALRWLALLTEPDDNEASLLKAILPDIGTLLNRPIPDSPQTDRSNAQSRLLKAVENMLRRQPQTVVIVLEDLQWAGSESIALLAYLNQIASRLPLLMIGSYRDDEKPNLPSALPDMKVMKLQRLTEKATAELTEAMLGPIGHQPDIIDFLHRETEGNVFFLVEVVRALAEETGQLQQIGSVTLPAQVFTGGVNRIVQRRLNRIPAKARPLLQIAAVAGREIDLEVLRQTAPLNDLERWLNTCADAAVLEVQNNNWRFAHDKLRNGVLIGLKEERRRQLHQQVASAIEALYPDAPEQAPILAYHWYMAGNTGQEARYRTMAGEQALFSGAYREAQDFLLRALELAENKHDAIYLKNRLAEAYLGLGGYETARQHYADSLLWCQETGDQLQAAETLTGLGNVAYALGDYEAAQKNYQESLDIFKAAGNQAGVAQTLNSLGNVAYELEEYAKAKELFQESLAISKALGSQWGMAGSVGYVDQKDE